MTPQLHHAERQVKVPQHVPPYLNEYLEEWATSVLAYQIRYRTDPPTYYRQVAEELAQRTGRPLVSRQVIQKKIQRVEAQLAREAREGGA